MFKAPLPTLGINNEEEEEKEEDVKIEDVEDNSSNISGFVSRDNTTGSGSGFVMEMEPRMNREDSTKRKNVISRKFVDGMEKKKYKRCRACCYSLKFDIRCLACTMAFFFFLGVGFFLFSVFQTAEYLSDYSRIKEAKEDQNRIFNLHLMNIDNCLSISSSFLSRINSISRSDFLAIKKVNNFPSFSSLSLILEVSPVNRTKIIDFLGDYSSLKIVNDSFYKIEPNKMSYLVVDSYTCEKKILSDEIGKLYDTGTISNFPKSYNNFYDFRVIDEVLVMNIFQEIVFRPSNVTGFLKISVILNSLVSETFGYNYDFSIILSKITSLEKEEEISEEVIYDDGKYDEVNNIISQTITEIFGSSSSSSAGSYGFKISLTFTPSSKNIFYGNAHQSTKFFMFFLPFIFCFCCFGWCRLCKEDWRVRKYKKNIKKFTKKMKYLKMNSRVIRKLCKKRVRKNSISDHFQDIAFTIGVLMKYIPPENRRYVDFMINKFFSGSGRARKLQLFSMRKFKIKPSSGVKSSESDSDSSNCSSDNSQDFFSNYNSEESVRKRSRRWGDSDWKSILTCEVSQSLVTGPSAKEITFLSVSITNLEIIFDKCFRHKQLRTFQEMYRDFSTSMVRIVVKSNRGEFHSFDCKGGLNFTWGVISNKLECEKYVARAAVEIMSEDGNGSFFGGIKTECRIGISTGVCLIDNLKVSEYKIDSNGIIGSDIMGNSVIRDLCFEFMPFSKNKEALQIPRIVVNQRFAEKIKYYGECIPIDYAKFGEKQENELVFGLVALKGFDDSDEWNYTLLKNSTSISSGCEKSNQLWNLLVFGREEDEVDCLKQMDTYLIDHYEHQFLFNHLVEFMKRIQRDNEGNVLPTSYYI